MPRCGYIHNTRSTCGSLLTVLTNHSLYCVAAAHSGWCRASTPQRRCEVSASTTLCTLMQWQRNEFVCLHAMFEADMLASGLEERSLTPSYLPDTLSLQLLAAASLLMLGAASHFAYLGSVPEPLRVPVALRNAVLWKVTHTLHHKQQECEPCPASWIMHDIHGAGMLTVKF